MKFLLLFLVSVAFASDLLEIDVLDDLLHNDWDEERLDRLDDDKYRPRSQILADVEALVQQQPAYIQVRRNKKLKFC